MQSPRLLGYGEQPRDDDDEPMPSLKRSGGGSWVEDEGASPAGPGSPGGAPRAPVSPERVLTRLTTCKDGKKGKKHYCRGCQTRNDQCIKSKQVALSSTPRVTKARLSEHDTLAADLTSKSFVFDSAVKAVPGQWAPGKLKASGRRHNVGPGAGSPVPSPDTPAASAARSYTVAPERLLGDAAHAMLVHSAELEVGGHSAASAFHRFYVGVVWLHNNEFATNTSSPQFRIWNEFYAMSAWKRRVCTALAHARKEGMIADLKQRQVQLEFQNKMLSRTIAKHIAVASLWDTKRRAMQRQLNVSKVKTGALEIGVTAPGSGFNREEKNKKSAAISLTVSQILACASGEGLKAAEIVDGILSHRTLKGILTHSAVEDDDQRHKDAVFRQLLESLDVLSQGRRNTPQWHAYQTLLNAIVPADYAHPKLLATALCHVSYRKIKQVASRTKELHRSGDWGIGHGVKERKDRWDQKYAHYLPDVIGFFESSRAVQVSPSALKPDHAKGNHRRNKELRIRECIDPQKCTWHPLTYLLEDQDGTWAIFCELHPAIAATMSLKILMQIRRTLNWLVPITERTCSCIYHENFYLMFEAYQRLAVELHSGCKCIDTHCDCDGGANCTTGRHPCRSVDAMMSKLLCQNEAGHVKRACLNGSCLKCGWVNSGLDACLGNTANASGEVEWQEIVTEKRKVVATNTDDDSDAYGEPKTKEVSEVVRLTHTESAAGFMRKFKEKSMEFFTHRELAHRQAEEFDCMVDDTTGIGGHDIVILVDYSMNHSHNHRNRTAGEHWSHHQSTVLPIVVYKRHYHHDGSSYVAAHSELIISDDLNHSNEMIKFAITNIIRKYKGDPKYDMSSMIDFSALFSKAGTRQQQQQRALQTLEEEKQQEQQEQQQQQAQHEQHEQQAQHEQHEQAQNHAEHEQHEQQEQQRGQVRSPGRSAGSPARRSPARTSRSAEAPSSARSSRSTGACSVTPLQPASTSAGARSATPPPPASTAAAARSVTPPPPASTSAAAL